MLHKEVTTMSQLRHENCISYLASFVEDRELWMVMKLMAGGVGQAWGGRLVGLFIFGWTISRFF